MSAHALRLAKILLNELFGELVAEVGSVLLKCGGQPLRDLVIETKLKKSEVSLLAICLPIVRRCLQLQSIQYFMNFMNFEASCTYDM